MAFGNFKYVLLVTLLFEGGCSVANEQQPPSEEQELARIAFEVSKKPLTPDQTEDVLAESGRSFIYGQGLGEAVLNIGTVVVFPPYALFLLGNAAASLAGYEPINISDALPDEERKEWGEVYDGVTSAPGQLAATVAGEDFQTKSDAQANLKRVLTDIQVAQASMPDDDARAQLRTDQLRTEEYDSRKN